MTSSIKDRIKATLEKLTGDLESARSLAVYTEKASRLCFKGHKKDGWRFVTQGELAPSVDEETHRILFSSSDGKRFTTNPKLTGGKFETQKAAQYPASFHPDDTDTVGYQLTNTIRTAHKSGICGRGVECNVAEDYLMRSAAWVDVLVVLRDDSDESCIGFVTLQIKPKRTLYVDVICSKGNASGQFLMQTMIKLADAMGHSLQLSSLSNLFAYYKQLGFEIRKDCSDAPDEALMKRLLDVGQQHGDRVTSKGVRFFSTAKLANTNPQMAELLQAHAAAGDNTNCSAEMCEKQLAASGGSQAAWASIPCSDDGTPLLRCPPTADPSTNTRPAATIAASNRPMKPSAAQRNKSKRVSRNVLATSRTSTLHVNPKPKPKTYARAKSSKKRRQMSSYTPPVTRSKTRALKNTQR
jgi:hypothetical protein